MTRASPQERNIAQVFQFPVIYDTMTVAENLPSPAQPQGARGPDQRQRGRDRRDAGDERPAQPARGRPGSRCQTEDLAGPGPGAADVAAVLFDEPLTVIDPHLKWQLRRKLKQIHHELNSR